MIEIEMGNRGSKSVWVTPYFIFIYKYKIYI